MLVCKERPATIPPLDAIGLDPVDHTHAISRGGSGHHCPSIAVPPSHRASVGLGFTLSALGKFISANNLFSMGTGGTERPFKSTRIHRSRLSDKMMMASRTLRVIQSSMGGC